MTEKIPIELCELIKEKPEITYLMLKIATKYLFTTIEKRPIDDDELDQIIWNFLNMHEAGEVKIDFKELN